MRITSDRLPQAGEKGNHLKQEFGRKLIDLHGQEMREIRHWQWGDCR